MRHSYLTNVGVASVLLLPAITLQQRDSRPLAEQLDATVRALEQLAGIESRVQAKDPTAVADLLRVTEAAAPDAHERDMLRDTLRDQVAELQSQLDQLPGAAATPETHGSAAQSSTPSSTRAASAPSAANSYDAPAEPARAAFEPHGYIADRAKLARVLYREQRFEEALVILGEARNESEALYWRGRCLEKLERFDDAIDAYERTIAANAEGPDAERAKEALDFLNWRADFTGSSRKEHAR